MHIKKRIRFILHTRKKGDSVSGKNLTIRLRITYAGNTPIDFPTNCSIDAQDWDKENERAKENTVNQYGQTADDINNRINEYRAMAHEVFARYELIEKRVPEPYEVKDLFNDMTGRKSLLPEKDIPNDELYHLLDTFTRTMGEQNQWTRSTYQKFATLKRHLQDYGKIKRLGTLTDEQMQGYIKHLHERGLRNTTIAKSLSFLKWFLRWCAQNGHYKGNLHDTFKPRLKGTDGNQKEVIYLTQDELRAMQQMKFTNSQKSLERVRDVFLFCCFTGLRYSDVAKLTKADVKNDTISIVTQKTSDGIHIELNKHSKAILEKYENEEFEEDKALPIISNQKMNDYLKEIGRLCEINERARIVYFKGNERHEALHPKWKLLTTHCGRRTFVVNALRLGIPSEVIMRWTGHSSFEAMKPYVKIVDELKKTEMKKFDDMI